MFTLLYFTTFVRDNPGEPVPEETFTHSHLSWLSIVPYLLHPSNTIHGILPIQSKGDFLRVYRGHVLSLGVNAITTAAIMIIIVH